MSECHLKLDYYGALNLHKALLEAKFHLNPDNELVSGSPLVAEVFIQVRDYLIREHGRKGWETWYQLKNRPDFRQRAILRMRANDRWLKLTREERKKVAGDYLAPFIYSEEELEAVVDEVLCKAVQ